MGHPQKQLSILSAKQNWKHQLCYGGSFRQLRAGRGQRPLSTREPIHCVFKINRLSLAHRSLRSPKNFTLTRKIINKYANKFFVKIDQISIQGDHVHLLLRATRRSHFHYFFRVVAGQVAQVMAKEGLLKMLPVTDTPNHKRQSKPRPRKLWKHRPFTRVVRGWRAYKTIRNYIQLNEQEARGKIPYQKQRLKDLKPEEWKILWPDKTNPSSGP